MRPAAALHRHAAAIVREQRRGEREGRIEDVVGSGGESGVDLQTFRVAGYTAGAGGVLSAAISGRKITNAGTGEEESSETVVYVRATGESLTTEQISLAPITAGAPPVTRQATSPRVTIGRHVVAWFGTTRYGAVGVTGWHKVGEVEAYNC